MSADTESSNSNIATAKTTNMSANETSAKLREKLKIHFNHNDFKSKLQQDAITTILNREYKSTC